MLVYLCDECKKNYVKTREKRNILEMVTTDNHHKTVYLDFCDECRDKLLKKWGKETTNANND